MSLIAQLASWFSPRSRTADLGAPSSDRERLRDEQRMLADEIESLFRVFDDRLQALARRSHELSESEFARESSRIRTAQDELRRALRRLEASVKTTPQLERELEQWERLPSDGNVHADHPIVRSEMIRSELAVRRGEVRTVSISNLDERPVKDVVDLIKQQLVAVEPMMEPVSSPDVDSASTEYQFQSYEPLVSSDTSQLMAAIQQATREAERWHAVDVTMSDEDAIVQVHHVRELHALLKRSDREQGIQRDRVAFAIKMHP